jgi:hypothetical protein
LFGLSRYMQKELCFQLAQCFHYCVETLEIQSPILILLWTSSERE